MNSHDYIDANTFYKAKKETVLQVGLTESEPSGGRWALVCNWDCVSPMVDSPSEIVPRSALCAWFNPCIWALWPCKISKWSSESVRCNPKPTNQLSIRTEQKENAVSRSTKRPQERGEERRGQQQRQRVTCEEYIQQKHWHLRAR